jgi:hypothetical protein
MNSSRVCCLEPQPDETFTKSQPWSMHYGGHLNIGKSTIAGSSNVHMRVYLRQSRHLLYLLIDGLFSPFVHGADCDPARPLSFNETRFI